MRKKAKNHSGARKRFKRTASGGLRRRRAGASHLMEHKNARRRRKYRRWTDFSDGDAKRYKTLLPY